MKKRFEEQKGVYPKEIIQNSQSVTNGVVRISGESGKLTLGETEKPVIGVVYDDFVINNFTITKGTGNEAEVAVEVKISLKKNYENLSVFAKLVNQGTEEVIAELPYQSAENTYKLDYKEGTKISASQIREDTTLVAYGAWGTKESDETELVLVEVYDTSAPLVKYSHIYPQKETSFITFPPDAKLENAHIDTTIPYEEGDGIRDEDHIVVALYRKPEDVSDLDYLCLFGLKTGTGRPLLGVPGKGIINALSGAHFLYGGQNEPKASCTISPIGGSTGGAMVVASTGTYEAGDGAIVLNKKDEVLEYDMTGSWGVAYDELGDWNVKKFHYQFKISYTIQTGSGLSRRVTSYICSNKEGCLEKVKPIALKYGCFRKGTAILMADGTQKKIEAVQIGDSVLVNNGEVSKIKNVWQGRDKILTIKLEDGNQIGMTKDHPVQTPDGWMKAGEIGKGMSLNIWNSKNTCCVQKVEDGGEDEVYNLELETESGCTLSANGIAAGDFFMQNNL